MGCKQKTKKNWDVNLKTSLMIRQRCSNKAYSLAPNSDAENTLQTEIVYKGLRSSEA